MKKIYNYLLPILLSLCVVSCDNDDEEVVYMNQQEPVVTVTEISPASGYVDTEFTVTGTNFGVVMDDVEVYLGSTRLELIACEDQLLTVRVPDGASAGKLSVVVYGQRVDTQLQYDVLGVPGVTAISPVYGFAGDVITFTGHDLGVSSAYYQVLFAGKTEAALLADEPTHEGFSVKVPEGAQSGAIALTIIEKPVNVPVQFTVLQHATLDRLSATQGFAGSEVTIHGTHLNPELLADADLSGVKVLFK
ncbi:IPT/TIG domain-containing protein [Bacteroides sp. AN502(2024)]|uniref:IPT/TIG domain-containing protein n=1 Tax=Bacteroides sp. AN502(2024) TaxID=3160599 RepID=UPI003513BD03